MECDDALGEKYSLVVVGFFVTHVDKRGEAARGERYGLCRSCSYLAIAVIKRTSGIT